MIGLCVFQPHRRGRIAAALLGVLLLLLLALPAAAQEEAAPQRSMLDLLQAGGWVGYLLLLLSVMGVALIVNAFLSLREDRLLPPALREQAMELAQRGRFTELLSITKTNDSMLGRTIAAGFDDGRLGVEAVREGMVQKGDQELLRLHQWVGYIGLIAGVAPVLGLLGTVLGMIDSFNVLGASRGTARPDELAVGISEALITTCLGLILAVPLMFFHAFLRNRVTRVGQELSATCERVLRLTAAVVEARQRPAPAPGTGGVPAAGAGSGSPGASGQAVPGNGGVSAYAAGA